MDENSIRVTNAIIHILDTNMDIPILSNTLLGLNGEIRDFIKNHIYKTMTSDNCKNTILEGEENYCLNQLKMYVEDNDFVAVTQNLSTKLFQFMKQNVDIPSGDVVFATFNCEGESYFSMLKMNYKSCFIHYVENTEEGVKNTIIKNHTILPSESQTLDEVIIIKLDDFSVKLIEKKYLINDKKEYYLSQYFLECQPELSPKAKLDIVTKTAEQINKKHYNDDVEKKMRFKKTLYDNCEADGTVDVVKVIDEVFENNLDAKNEFKERIMKKGIDKREIQLQNRNSFKKLERQIIKTDTGIEINIPLEQYEDREKLEFINNPDGTISILIKNIGKIEGK